MRAASMLSELMRAPKRRLEQFHFTVRTRPSVMFVVE
jgi:hypothetical protein